MKIVIAATSPGVDAQIAEHGARAPIILFMILKGIALRY